ncbi:hypothetical protein QR685DRAFT_523185 [Neurospora intermedia]|uniref:Secreted protein n=1 Tax=Neurospora intermedia TaxID=5142 RepID=A0ABR3DCB1_NEUIN
MFALLSLYSILSLLYLCPYHVLIIPSTQPTQFSRTMLVWCWQNSKYARHFVVSQSVCSIKGHSSLTTFLLGFMLLRLIQTAKKSLY